MSTYQTATEQDLRIRVADFKARLDAGEPATILDTRGEQAWQSSSMKIRGARRLPATDGAINAPWPKNQLTVAYCT